MKKILNAMLVLFIAVLTVSNVFAYTDVSTTPAYQIGTVELNDVEMNGDTVQVQLGEDMELEVIIKGNDTRDVRVKAWVGGYEYGDISARTEVFEINPGVNYKKTLQLTLPRDLDTDKNYKLHIQVYDNEDEAERTYNLFVDEARHDIDILDIILRPGNFVDAGRPLFASVWVKNTGAKTEEDVSVVLSIPQLGLSTRDMIMELAPEDDYSSYHGYEDSGVARDLYLVIPNNVQTGDYEVVVDVIYNNGHSVVSEKSLLHIEGVAVEDVQETANGDETLVRVDSTNQRITQGETTVYTLVLANLGSESKLYTAEVVGTNNWGNAVVEPGFLTVLPGQTAEMQVSVTADAGALASSHIFTVRVSDGNEVVEEVNLNAQVVEADKGSELDTRTIVEITFAALVVLIVVIALIALLFSRGKSKDSDDDEPLENQTYY